MRTLAAAALFFSLALAAQAADKQQPAQPAQVAARKIEVKVTNAGFEPREIKLKKGETTTIIFTRVTDRTCITAIDIPDEGVKSFQLPLNRPAYLTLTPKKAGLQKFHCTAMGMGDGKLIVSE